MMIDHLYRLADAMEARGVASHWQLGLHAAGSTKFFLDLRTGQRRSCTLRTYERVIQWFSDHWPADLEWPADIPRPAPRAGGERGEAA